MKKVFLQPLLLIVMTLLSCGQGGQSVKQLGNIKDTPYQPDSILVTYAKNPERALVLLDSAVLLGTIDPYNEQFVRATIYSKSLEEQRQDSALAICEALLQNDSVLNNAGNYENVLNLLINISHIKADYNEYLRWSLMKAELCRDQDEEVELLRTEAEIGLVMTRLGRVEEGIAKIDNSISQLDKEGSTDRLDAFIIASKRKITVLNEQGRYQETIPLVQRILERLSHYEQHAAEYAEDSYRLPRNHIPDERSHYIDFCRAQAYGFLAIAYAKTGNVQQAREYLAMFNQSGYGQTFSARRMIIPAQMALGMYDEVLKTSDLMVKDMREDTTNLIYAEILRNRAIAARAHGNASEAFDLMNRHTLLYMALSDSLHKSEAQDYAARYHAKEQELKIQKAESESRQKTYFSMAIAVLFIMAMIALFYFHRQNQRIARKNRALVRMINKNYHLAVESDADEMVEDEAADDTAELTAADKSDQDAAIASADPLISLEDFLSLDSVIRKEGLYKKTNLQRKEVCERFGITRIMLNAMLSQHRGNASFPQYVNSIRMEEAIKLMRENPDMTFTAIAEEVGFSLANFRKHFMVNFGMTPQEYRQNW